MDRIIEILKSVHPEIDYDGALASTCQIEDKYVNGFTLFTLTEGENVELMACRQYNQSNYLILFRTHFGDTNGIMSYYDDIVGFLEKIKIT